MDREAAALPSPNAGELDVLGVLWEQQAQSNRPLKLSEVYKRVCERRLRHGDPEPALTTVSTHLRSLVAKGLIRETLVTEAASPRSAIRTRGMLTPATRSPLTGYQVLHAPGEVLSRTMRGLAASYPPGDRLQALADFARVLEVTPDEVEQLRERLRQAERLAGPPRPVSPGTSPKGTGASE